MTYFCTVLYKFEEILPGSQVQIRATTTITNSDAFNFTTHVTENRIQPIFKAYIQKETNTILHRLNSKPDEKSLFPTPTITFYNKAWNSFGPGKARTRCKQTFDCDAFLDSTNETLLSKSDIVVFSPWMDHQMKFGDIEKFHGWINSLRNKHQLFVFYQIESPYHVQLPYSKHNNFFNATISYRKNSSFRYPYSSIADISRLAGSIKEWELPKKKYGAIAQWVILRKNRR